MISSNDYPLLYLQGIHYFNENDYFQAHECWETCWRQCPLDDRRFFLGLVQAAVCVYHANRGNWSGATRLFQSGHKYMSIYPSRYHGLDISEFWQQMTAYLPSCFNTGEQAINLKQTDSVPRIQLEPEPTEWPRVMNHT